MRIRGREEEHVARLDERAIAFVDPVVDDALLDPVGEPPGVEPVLEPRLPPWYTLRIVARFLVEVQERGAEEEERRDHEARDERGDRQGLVAGATQEEEEAALRQEDEDREGREGAERVDEVRPGEPVRAQEGEAEADPFKREHGTTRPSAASHAARAG